MLRYPLRWILNRVLSFIPIFFAPAAFSLPDTIRKGYPTCIACHVSPSGGGVLTAYGRGVSQDFFTFGWEGSGSFAGIPQLDEWGDPSGLFSTLKADLQADFRSVSYHTQTPKAEISGTIMMERTAHLALHVGKTTDLVMSYGQYGNDLSRESRTHYFQVRTSRFLSFRAGRFLPAIGLNIDDHTAFTRAGTGFKQGGEALGLEAHFETEHMVFTLNRIFGRDVVIHESNKKLAFNSPTKEGLVLRSGVKFGPRYATGLSLYHDQTQDIAGVWATVAPIKDWVYLLSDVQYKRTKIDELIDERQLIFLRLGSEIFRGVVISLNTNAEISDSVTRTRYSFMTQLMPVPHLELQLEGRKEDDILTFLVMSHLWL